MTIFNFNLNLNSTLPFSFFQRGSNIFKSKSGTISISISIYLGSWAIYYLVSESIRIKTIKNRSTKHRLNRRNQADLESSPLTDSEWFGGATSSEAQAIKSRFQSFSVLGRYCNVTSEWREQGIWELIAYKSIFLWQSKGRGLVDSGFQKDMKTLEGREKIERTLPVVPLDGKKLWGKGYREKSEAELEAEVGEEELVGMEKEREQPAADVRGTTYTWIGQSTCLIQAQGLTILTDPVFSIQPLQSIFAPKRLRPMPCSITAVLQGRVDVVLLSHNHFDHIDLSILKLFPKYVKWFVPLGVKKLLKSNGLKKEVEVVEIDWWQEIQLKLKVSTRDSESIDPNEVEMTDLKVKVTGLPALHWTGRLTPIDTNTTLWCSYAVKIESSTRDLTPTSLFFSCDTGYSSSLFTSIGRLLGPFDLAIIPIGSYAPRWHMSIQHTDPKGSVAIAKDIGAKKAFATHWGTWMMSEEPWDEPVKLLREEVEGKEGDWFRATGMGETIDL